MDPINFFLPFFPNLLIVSAQSAGVYEGTPLMPSLFANASEKQHFKKSMKLVIIAIFCYNFFLTPLAVLRFGHQVLEIIIMNL